MTFPSKSAAFRACLAFALPCLIVGCGNSDFKEPPKVNVAGTVLLDGQPLANGTIVFEEGGKGLVDQLDIDGGKFSGQVSPGEKKVKIASEKDGPPNEMYPDKPTKINIIPEKYSALTELKATIPKEGASGLEFKLDSK
jgi:hypothetical protein